jgi:hypothetical protein
MFFYKTGEIGSFGVCFMSVGVVGQTPNVPMWAGIKLFFKMCDGKNFKTISVGLRVGKVRWFVARSSTFAFRVCLMVVVSVFTLAGNVLQLQEVGDFHYKCSCGEPNFD